VKTEPRNVSQAITQFSEITPALRAWMRTQQSSGFTADEIMQGLVEAGWSDAVVAHLMAPPQANPLAATANAARAATDQRMPWPGLAGERLVLDAGDCEVRASLVLREPALVVLDDFLSEDECRALVEQAAPRMTRSLTVDLQTGGEATHQSRTSQGMFFERGESALISRIEARIAHLLDWPVQNGEGLQVLRYEAGAEYLPHFDYFDPAAAGTPAILERGGQRVATLVMYLHEPEAGGATVFTDAALSVLPKRGSAVFFSYSQAHPDSLSLHGGAPVLAGEKWVATKWLRERAFF
jgi:prolyl 4-hydroxylase